MGDLRLVHVLGLQPPSQRLQDRLKRGVLDSTAPIFVPRWNRPPAPVVHGGNGAGHVNVVEADVGEANVGEANVGEANVGMAGDLQHLQPPAVAPDLAPDPARDAVAPLLPAEGCRVQGTRPDDPPALQRDFLGADASQSAKEGKEGKDSGASGQP